MLEIMLNHPSEASKCVLQTQTQLSCGSVRILLIMSANSDLASELISRHTEYSILPFLPLNTKHKHKRWTTE